jgi:4-phytase / acid phosphatase
MSFFRSLLLLALACPAFAPAQTVTNDDTVLKQFIIFGRHSVRAPTPSRAQYATYSPRPYPDFNVLQEGYLTPHGQQAEILLGTYYRGYLMAEGLLTGDTNTDLPHSYFRANSIQRSNLTATKLGFGIFNGTIVPVHSYPLGQPDPVFDPILAGVAVVDADRAAKEAHEIYNSGAALASAYSAEFGLVRSVIYNYQDGVQPPPPAPANVTDPTVQPISLDALTSLLYTGNLIDQGGLLATNTAADPFVMEYANNMAMADVGWGQLSPATLSQVTRITTLALGIAMRTPYVAQVQSSNAAAHILRSMRQVVLGQAVPGAFGDPTTKVLGVISSDAYITGLAGLLGLHWQLPSYQPDFCTMGGALVFELRQSTRTGEYLVRVFYTAQSLDQLRNLTPLSISAPPETMQLQIPGGSKPGASFDVKFEVFQKLVMEAIGPQYVQSPMQEVPPGVLASVPGQ